MLHLDFETRSFLDVREVGAYRYAEDPSTSILCFSYSFDGKIVKRWRRGEEFPQEIANHIAAGGVICAHNAFFERSIWRCIGTPKLGWPEVRLRQWRCTAAKAAAAALPRDLEGAGKALGLSVIKDKEGQKVMQKMCRPRKPTKNNPSIWHEDPADFEILYRYCDTDVLAEAAVDRALPDLRPLEQEIWFLDQQMNDVGVMIDQKAVKGAIKVLSEHSAALTQELRDLTGEEIQSAKQAVALVRHINQVYDLDLSNLTAETVEKYLSKKSLPSEARRILEIRQSLGKASTAKYDKMVQCVCSDGRIKDILMYHGASTGRWGGKFVQLHNLPRGKFSDGDKCAVDFHAGDLDWIKTMYGDPSLAASTAIRSALVAGAGNTLLVADYNAIEARGLFWIANEQIGVQGFKNKQDLYSDTASDIYGYRVNKNDHPDERQVGKQATLGCGYQMGASKFLMTCHKYGIMIDENLAERAVKAYRSRYRNVVKFWTAVENAAVQAVMTKRPIRQGKLIWAVQNGFLYCKLPSGRCLAYYNPSVEPYETPWGDTRYKLQYWGMKQGKTGGKKWMKQDTYGGRLTENIVQGMCRDIMAEAMLRCNNRGYTIRLTVHDELIAEVPENYGSIDEFVEIMCKVPEWAEGFPIAAEGWKGKRYKK